MGGRRPLRGRQGRPPRDGQQDEPQRAGQELRPAAQREGTAFERDVPDGFMRRYRKYVRPACEGAVLD